MEMFASLLVWVFLFFLFAFLYGLAKPQTKIYQKGFQGRASRKKLVKVFMPALMALLVMIGALSPDTNLNSKNTADNNQQDVAKVESAHVGNKFYSVTSVVDGDTIKVDVNGTTETVRFIGMDTPETVHPSKPVECFGQEASAHMKSLVFGKKVRLVQDKSQSDRDKYRRLLRYVYLEDKTHVNLRMIADGYAYEYTYNSNPYKLQAEFKAAELAALNAGVGLWSADTCNGERTTTEVLGSQTTTSDTQSAQAASQPATQSTTSAPAAETSTEPAPEPAPAPLGPDCDPNYTPCLPRASRDLDCKDIGQKVTVIGTDHYRLDRNGDGAGCEMYW